MSRPVAIVPAAGSGVRMGGGEPKQFREIGGVPILLRTLTALRDAEVFERIIVAVSDDERARVEAWVREIPGLVCVTGGEERFHSVKNGLDAVDGEGEGVPGVIPTVPGTGSPGSDDERVVLVHDGVRPFVTAREIVEVVAAAERDGAAIVCSQPVETVKSLGEGGGIVETLDRERVRLAQTPQAFQTGLFHEAYMRAESETYVGTDEASLVERLGYVVSVVEADRWNIKITTPEDFELAEWILKERR
ncbi:MAG: 2-C-methyl-D-erythritol 4-phosphate cytidylyltransferase [Gemmatimonadetes bacterium]|nr:2-C-methyl-D-erythritol 4-phosphate cytidylyltransferase [Gemmatimonadota bacterium]